MSEPRVDDAKAIHAFHLSACAAVWASDPAAGCFVGPGKFYDRTHLTAEYVRVAFLLYVYISVIFPLPLRMSKLLFRGLCVHAFFPSTARVVVPCVCVCVCVFDLPRST